MLLGYETEEYGQFNVAEVLHFLRYFLIFHEEEEGRWDPKQGRGLMSVLGRVVTLFLRYFVVPNVVVASNNGRRR